MLRARLDNGMFVLGIDAENVKRLKEGKPIFVQLEQLGGTDSVCIMYGETLKHILNELIEAGLELNENANVQVSDAGLIH